MKKNFPVDRILNGRKPYTPSLSTEWNKSCLPGNIQGGVKCEEGAFLLLTEDSPVFLDQEARKILFCKQEEAVQPCNDLDGWTAEIAFAQDVILACTFFGNTLFCGEDEMTVQCRTVRKHLYLISTETDYGPLMIVLDTARFLVYGAVGSNFLGGYIRNMPQDR